MKFAFITCVRLGLGVIEKVYEAGGRFEFFVTLKDGLAKNKSGRIYLDETAAAHRIPLLKVNSVNERIVVETVEKYEIDWLFIIGWSQIVKKELLCAPGRGCIGMHPTLLPVGRGRAPVPWAILKGLDKTGVTMFRLDDGVDTGDILGQEVIPLRPDITATELYSAVEEAHRKLIGKYWQDLVNDTLVMTKQDDDTATEWPARRPEDGRLKADMTVAFAERLVRADTHPYPGAFYEKDGIRIVIWKAKISDTPQGNISFRCRDGYLVPVEYHIEQGENNGTESKSKEERRDGRDTKAAQNTACHKTNV